MIIGYARVSSTDQNLERQLDNLKTFGVKKIFTEKQSGKSVENRPVLQEALNFVRMGDRFVVESIDRLGRNYDEVINTVNYLKDKKVQLMNHRVIEMLKEGQAISKIAREVNITRQTVYRIKNDIFLLNKVSNVSLRE
ncbi:recombinase family protein [Staphylococcus hominis]|uniref:recombinase family protein n=1 Tax=Staphylococcus hominis TaxID=1290 RepID=UPI00098B5551|nr:recombinase family protein [Staphylococcus hominis]